MNLSNYEEQQLEEILRQTESSARNLCAVWKRTFDEEICQDNLRRLHEHAKNFYNDLIQESLQKESYIRKEIDELRSEGEDLQRLLNTEINFPEIAEVTDVPLLVIQREIDKSLQDLRKELRCRREQICDLLLEQELLCEELGEPPRELLADPLPTAIELEDFRQYLDDLKEERNERLQQLHALRREIKNYLQILDLNINTDCDDRLLNQRQIQLSKQTFDGLHKLSARFGQQVDELKTRIDNMREKLLCLWDRLETPKEERQKVENCVKYDQYTADILYQELTRCEEIKQQNIKHYIQTIRGEIEYWWNRTFKSDKERRRFTNFTSHNYTDELLQLHELELEDLKLHYNNNKEIFELFCDRNVLWDRMCALEQKASDPGRYNNRGGQLLKEEKERKTIATKLPKIEQQIREHVEEYQHREHKNFLIYGEDILEVMAADWEKKRQEKEAQSNARKNAITPQQSRALNPSNVTSLGRTPLAQRNASSSTLRKAPSTMSLSVPKQTNLVGSALKRKLNPNEKTTPIAKRCLWNSQHDAFKKPTDSATKPLVQVRKKLPRVLATTIRRRSGRLSIKGSKRRSLNKSARGGAKRDLPNIIVSHPSSTDDENYDTFKNCISTESRSSIQHESTILNKNKLSDVKKRRQQQKLAAIQEANKNQKTPCTQSKPHILRTPSKQSIRDYPVSPTCSNNRKLTTKNLPILI